MNKFDSIAEVRGDFRSGRIFLFMMLSVSIYHHAASFDFRFSIIHGGSSSY